MAQSEKTKVRCPSIEVTWEGDVPQAVYFEREEYRIIAKVEKGKYIVTRYGWDEDPNVSESIIVSKKDTARLMKTESNTGYDAEYVQNPLMNLYFTRDHKLWQMQMHLDTYFNIIDRDLCTMVTSRLEAKPGEPEYGTCDIWAREAGVKVEWIPLENLIGGYGAAHCMTQVLRRARGE